MTDLLQAYVVGAAVVAIVLLIGVIIAGPPRDVSKSTAAALLTAFIVAWPVFLPALLWEVARR